MRYIRISMLVLACSAAAAQPPQSAAPQAVPTVRAGAEEVVLDVVVRDKKGKLVRDLGASDFEVYDNGVKQGIRSVRLVEGQEATSTTGGSAPLDPMRQIRLVTLAFERLSPEGRRFARQAAQDLLRAQPPQNVFYAVMAIDQKLSVLQQFTADTTLLRKAVERATSGLYAEFPADSDRIKQQLQRQLAAPPDGRSVSEQIQGQIAASPRDPSQALMAQAMLNILQFNQSLENTESARISIFSLMAMVRGQAALPGRKTILYFTEGLRIPTNLDTAFDGLMSAANRANVAFYGIDARGLLTSRDNASAMSELAAAAAGSKTQAQDTGGRAVTPQEVKASDTAEESMKANVQTELRNLAESTGGFLIANTNDLRAPLRKVVEEVESYYEISYDPHIETYDGRFHKTTVRLVNSDAHVQARSGYFALPAGEMTAALRPYEAPLLKALGASPLPKDVAFRSAVVRLDHRAGDVLASLLVEVPLNSLTFAEDKAANTYSARTSVVALVKNAQGEVVKKFEQDLPIRGPLERLAAVKQAHFLYKDQFAVPAGRYTVESAVLDGETARIGARRAVFIAQNKPAGVGLSSISIVRRFEPNAQNLDPADPFQISGGRVTPTLAASLAAAKGAQLSLFFIVYPDPSIADKPSAFVEYLLDGQTMGRGEVTLSAPDSKGRIPCIMSSTVEGMKPGMYEIRVVVKQGQSATEERTTLTIEAPAQ